MVTLDHAPPPIEGGSLVTGTPLEVWWRRILARTVEPSDILSLSESQWPGMSVIDADRVNGPLSVCPWNAGDKVLLADRSATKSVARLLSDAGVSRLERLWTPIVSDSDGIVLIFGLGEAERVKVTDKTRRGIVVSSV
jgi:tRNA(Ile)-lysidine synthetase-like protein